MGYFNLDEILSDVSYIPKQKGVSLERFIYALGIRETGSATARLLAKNFISWPNFYEAMTKENAFEVLTHIEGIGPVMADFIIDFFKEEHNKKEDGTYEMVSGHRRKRACG